MKLKKEHYAIIATDVYAKAQYLEQNATPIEIETGLLETALAPRRAILEAINKVIAPEADDDETSKNQTEKSSLPTPPLAK